MKDLIFDKHESFPMNGYLHTDCESFTTRKFCRMRYTYISTSFPSALLEPILIDSSHLLGSVTKHYML